MPGVWYASIPQPSSRLLTTKQDLCRAALEFTFEVLRTGGHFICKFYQGAEDKQLEKQLKELFQKVHRLKPESSRSVKISIEMIYMSFTDRQQESKEAYFVALGRKHLASREAIFPPT